MCHFSEPSNSQNGHEPLGSLLSWFQDEAEAQHCSEPRTCKGGEGGHVWAGQFRRPTWPETPPGTNHEPNGTKELLIIYQTFLKDNMVQRAAHMGWVWFLLESWLHTAPVSHSILGHNQLGLELSPFSLLDRANAFSTSNSAKPEQIPCSTPLTTVCPPLSVHLQLDA